MSQEVAKKDADSASIKKRGLGRGLDALFGEAEETTYLKTPAPSAPQEQIQSSQSSLRTLPITKLSPGKYQPRHHFDEEALDELSRSIGVHGVIQPILVRQTAPDQYEIIAGERRWRAAQRVPLHEVPVIIQELNDADALEIALIENLQRQDLNIIEEADGFQRLMDEFNYSQEELASRIGKSRSQIANTLRLLKLPTNVRKYLENGKLTAGHGRALLMAQNPVKMVEEIISKNLNVRAVEKLIAREQELPAHFIKDAESAHFKGAESAPLKTTSNNDSDISTLEESIGNAIGMKVRLEHKGGAGRLVIDYRSLDDLDLIIERLMGVKK